MQNDESTVPDIGDFFYSSPDLLSVFGEDGELVLVNPAWHDMLGWDLEDMRGVPFWVFIHPDDVQATEDEFRIVIRGPDETRRGFVNRQRCRDGTYRSISWSSLRKDGWICATGQDVTDRQEIQKRLNKSTAITEAMFDAAADSIIIIDRDLIIVESSPETEQIYGFPGRSRLGRTGLDIVDPIERPAVEAALRRTFEVDDVTTIRFRARHADGHEITLESRGRALRTSDGPSARAVFITRDVTEAAQTEADLSENLTKMRAIIDTAVDAISVIDRDGIIREVSPASELMYGIPDEHRRGHAVIDFVHYNDQAVVTAAIRRTFMEGEASTARFRVRHSDGHWVTVESRGRALDNHGEPPVSAVFITRDISESVALEHALEIARSEAERHYAAKSEFMSRMSHELRTPLNSVIGFSQLLQMESSDPDVLRMLGHINNSGQHLLNLINEILDISRIESGRVIVTLRAVSLDDMVRDCVGIITLQANQRDIHLEVGAITDALVRADQQRLRQVVLNLLSNAIKYNRPGGRVIVSTEVVGDMVRISVSDTGLGIRPEMVERLFIPFDRLNVEATGVEGTGLGLALSKNLTEAMGGTLSFDSTPGKGSIFTIELPIFKGS
ncbi:MAG TPA: PAS domain S-box protein [Acidimicrobiales bacterium]|nr:PAS domain S-box protein [Acidimicrobiales bacterium]